MLLQLAVAGATLYVAHKNEDYAPIAAAIEGVGGRAMPFEAVSALS